MIHPRWWSPDLWTINSMNCLKCYFAVPSRSFLQFYSHFLWGFDDACMAEGKSRKSELLLDQLQDESMGFKTLKIHGTSVKGKSWLSWLFFFLDHQESGKCFVLNMGKQFERLVFKKERMAVGLFRFYVKWGWIEADLLKRNVEICDILFIPSDICWVSEARLICNSERLSAQMKAKTLRWSPAGWLGRNGRASPMGFFLQQKYTRWWFQIFCIFIWGRFPIWLILIFFKGVETTN